MSTSPTPVQTRKNTRNKPLGFSLFAQCFKFRYTSSKRNFYKALVLTLTFLAYATSHMSRRPFTVVKNVLNRNCSAIPRPPHSSTTTETSIPLLPDTSEEILADLLSGKLLNYTIGPKNTTAGSYHQSDSDLNWCDWKPFDDDRTAEKFLAFLDGVFLFTYALTMFFSGPIAERLNLRYLLTASLWFGGGGLIAFGLAKELEIHSLLYFTIVQIVCGFTQAFAWPVVVTCVANWFGSRSRGLMFATWNSHTNVGNILGLVVSGAFVETNWMLSFVVPGHIMIVVGLIMFLFLVPRPIDADLKLKDDLDFESSSGVDVVNGSLRKSSIDSDSIGDMTKVSKSKNSSTANLVGSSSSLRQHQSHQSKANLSITGDEEEEEQVLSFWKAFKIPGVVEFSLCLFFAKLVSYTFLFWLPRYINQATTSNSEQSAFLSIPFDLGGIVGAVAAGYLSDVSGLSAIPCNIMLVFAIPSMIFYDLFGTKSIMSNILIQSVVGAFVNGPYCLITTAISADLGNKVNEMDVASGRSGKSKSMATVVGIIDGAGSLGAFVGPSLAPLFMEYSLKSVFIMLIGADILAMLCLTRLSWQEGKQKWQNSS